jgi:hypothetical protein
VALQAKKFAKSFTDQMDIEFTLVHTQKMLMKTFPTQVNQFQKFRNKSFGIFGQEVGGITS